MLIVNINVNGPPLVRTLRTPRAAHPWDLRVLFSFGCLQAQLVLFFSEMSVIEFKFIHVEPLDERVAV
jgi:hypothetical protein